MTRVGQGKVESIPIPSIKKTVDLYHYDDNLIIVGVPPDSKIGQEYIESGWESKDVELEDGNKVKAISYNFDKDTLKEMKQSFVSVFKHVEEHLKYALSKLSKEELEMFKAFESITEMAPVQKQISRRPRPSATKTGNTLYQASNLLMTLYGTQEPDIIKSGNQVILYGPEEFIEENKDDHRELFRVVLKAAESEERILAVLEIGLAPPSPKRQ